MENYMVQKMMKEHKHRKLVNHPDPRETPISNSPSRSSVKDEFLKSYLAQSGGTKLHKQFTLSWGNKQEEKKRREEYMTNVVSKDRGEYFGKSPKNQLLKVPREYDDDQGQKRVISEPPKESESIQSGKAVDALKEYFDKKYGVKSPRGGSYSSLPKINKTSEMSYGFPLGKSDLLQPPGEKCTPRSSVSGDKTVLKGLEEVYAKDFRNGRSKPGKNSSLDVSPYSKNYIIEPKKQARDLHRLGRSIAHDHILMNRFENPYADNLPFEKPIHASIMNKQNYQLQELEMKIQILRNIKEIEETLTQEKHNKMQTPKKRFVIGGRESVNGKESAKPSDKDLNTKHFISTTYLRKSK